MNESFLNYYFRNDEVDIWEWEEHATDHPSHQAVIAEAISILDRLSLKWGEAKIRREFLKLQESLVTAEATINIRPLNRLSINRFVRHWVAGLAASLLLVAGFWWLNAHPPTTRSPMYRQLVAGKSLIEHVNTTAQPMPVTLPDGSTVQLYGQSRLSYPAQFTPEKREIYLDGKAFFEVKKDAQKPFFVYANSLVTRVLGTSFTVIARPSRRPRSGSY